MLDKLIIEFDKIIKTLSVNHSSQRAHPDYDVAEADLSVAEQKKSVALMRVNYCGEVCAQGLYQGQALTSRNKENRELFEHAAFEETEHLAWLTQRINELGGRPSILNPIFYAGSLAMGIGAGILGDKWSLGFLEETEIQVGEHLTSHLDKLPASDIKSRKILEQMQIDETKHANIAHSQGAAKLPVPVRFMMKGLSKVMTHTTYHI